MQIYRSRYKLQNMVGAKNIRKNFVGFVIFCFVFLHEEFSNCQTLSDVKTLYTDLFTGYRKEVMPMANHSQPLKIGIGFYLASFNSFNEVEETLSLTAAIGINWTDPSLVWNPNLYGNLYYTIIDNKDLWLPRIFLANRVDSMSQIGDDTKFFAVIAFDGQVNYSPGGIIDAKCPTDISKFPFDRQTCVLRILPWGIPASHIVFSSMFDKAQLDFFTPHSDWKLEEYSAKAEFIPVGYHQFEVTLTIKRQPLYFTVMIILPTLLFSLLNPLVFVLPPESGERVSLSMTILLSYAIFLTLVSASIPTSSNPMCVLLVAMIVIISISGLIVIGTIFSGKYFFIEDETKIGNTLKKITRTFLKTQNKVIPLDEKKEQAVTGRDVAHVLDWLFFYGTYLGIIITVGTYFIYVLV